MRKDVTWNDTCHCGKRFGDHNNQDLHDCELTGDENQRGLSKTYSRKCN